MPIWLLEQHVRQGNLMAAQREFERLLIDLPSDDYLNLAWTHFWGAKAKNAHKDNYGATRLMQIALAYAERVSDWTLIGRIRLDAGEFYRQLGDFHLALTFTTDFLRGLPLYPSLSAYEGAAHYNLGIIHRCRRDLDQSELHYTQAEQILRTAANRRWHLMALQNLAWILFEQEKFEAGDRHLNQAEILIEGLGDRATQLTQKYFRAFGAIRRSDIPLAASYSEEILSSNEASDEQRAWATWILAECALQMGHFPEASALTHHALALATETVKDARIIQYVSDTRRKLYTLMSASDGLSSNGP